MISGPARRSGLTQRGFSLLELMITLSLLGILFAVGLPGFMTWIRNTQVRTVAEALQNGVRTAQAEAIRRNRSTILSFTDSIPSPTATLAATARGKNWWLEAVPQFGDTSTSSPPYIEGGSLAGVGSSVTINGDPADLSIQAICFNSNGRLIANAAGTCSANVATFNITQTNADRPLRVIVQIGGQVRMCDPAPTLSSTAPDRCP